LEGRTGSGGATGDDHSAETYLREAAVGATRVGDIEWRYRVQPLRSRSASRQQAERRLAVILAADVAGYSRLMGGVRMSASDGHNYPIVPIDERDPVTTMIIADGAIPRGTHL
jgi:hypothetical protein